MKRFFLTLLILTMLASAVFADSAGFVISFGSGKKIELTNKFEFDGNDYFSVLELFNALGARPLWNPRLSRMTFKLDTHLVSFLEGDNHVSVDGEMWLLPGPIRSFGAVLAMPVEFISTVLAEVLAEKVEVSSLKQGEVTFGDWNFPGALNDFLPKRKISLDTFDSSEEFIIVIDPGHGGDDYGAVAKNGAREKDVVLGVALLLEQYLSGVPNLRVLMTRREDYYITLRRRTEKANLMGADMFVSIHANAARRLGADGIETYFLSAAASDDDARRTAQLENQAFEREEEVLGARDDVKGILSDLSRSESMRESEIFAESLQTELVKSLSVTDRGVKQAPFYVLMGVTMPSVLVEIGFMSNETEAKRLLDPQYQQAIAQALGRRIVEHLNRLRAKRAVQ